MIYMPTVLRDRFKVLCNSNGESMSAVVAALIGRYWLHRMAPCSAAVPPSQCCSKRMSMPVRTPF